MQSVIRALPCTLRKPSRSWEGLKARAEIQSRPGWLVPIGQDLGLARLGVCDCVIGREPGKHGAACGL